jgi:hypothetical protein
MPASVRPLTIVALLALLATLPYLPFFSLPHISDDYLQIELGRTYGPVSGWSALAADALYRCRATSIVLTHWTEQAFGAVSAVFQAESIVVHILITFLIAALGWWRKVGWPIAILAAAFFAIHEGHQEAVVWYASLPELLVLLFALAALHAWLAFLKTEKHKALFYSLTFASFLLALLSKESGVVAVALFAGVALWEGRSIKSLILPLAPFAALSAFYAALIFAAKSNHLHLNDGTFSLSAPFLLVAGRTTFRLLWIWGLVALAVIAWKRPPTRALIAASFAWIFLTLLPYSFLAYMPFAPSRHVYWASVGLAFLVAIALYELRNQKSLAYTLAALMLLHNVGYLWVKKYDQYQRRAAATENLITFSERIEGPITVKCFPYAPELAAITLEVSTGRPKSDVTYNPDAPNAYGVFCEDTHP